MPGECVHIFNALGQPGGRCGATHTTAKRNTDAGDLPLERPEYQFFVAVEVKPGPVQVFKLVKQKRRKL